VAGDFVAGDFVAGDFVAGDFAFPVALFFRAAGLAAALFDFAVVFARLVFFADAELLGRLPLLGRFAIIVPLRL
jgi:hypothetical protein